VKFGDIAVGWRDNSSRGEDSGSELELFAFHKKLVNPRDGV